MRRTAEVRTQLANRELPLVLDPDSSTRLRGWKFREIANSAISGQSQTEDGKKLLQLQAQGTWAAGSWRKSVLLEGGNYEFTGLGRVEGLAIGATNSGILLRISGERDATNLVTAAAWTPMTYSFETPGPTEIEFICEYRGSAGRGLFDASSLILRRLPASMSQKLP